MGGSQVQTPDPGPNGETGNNIPAGEVGRIFGNEKESGDKSHDPTEEESWITFAKCEERPDNVSGVDSCHVDRPAAR